MHVDINIESSPANGLVQLTLLFDERFLKSGFERYL